MSTGRHELEERTLRYLDELASGRCSITEEEIEQERQQGTRRIMRGLLDLHESHEILRRKSSAACDAMMRAETGREAMVQRLVGAGHELRTSIEQVRGHLRRLLQTEPGDE